MHERHVSIARVNAAVSAVFFVVQPSACPYNRPDAAAEPHQ